MYNKTLGITEDAIFREDDLGKLREMRIDIENHLAETKISFSKYNRLTTKQKQYLSSLVGLRKLCKAKISNRMGELREKGVWRSNREIKEQMHLASIFMEESKKRLPSELYKEILEISKERLCNNN